MPDRQPQFAELERLLRRAGIIEASSQRLVDELQDHYRDLCDEALRNGHDEQLARKLALRAIGAPADIVAVAAQCRELLSMSRRYPLLADVAHSLVAIPAMPVQLCAERRESIVRWSASVGLAGMLTAGLLLSLQTVLGII